MNGKGSLSIKVLIVVACVIGAAGSVACKKKATNTTPTTLGGPAPGPIIDTTGDPGGQIAHRFDETPVNTSSGDTDKLDLRFFKGMYSAVLVDSTTKTTYGLAKGDEVIVTFSDGKSYKVTIGDAANPLTWKCSDVAGKADVDLDKGNAGQVPECMSTKSRTFTSMKASTGESGDLLIIKTVK